MFKFTLSLLSTFFAINIMASVTIQYDENHIIYGDDELHLYFMLNTESKEAMLGTGSNDDIGSAIYRPPLGDPWWSNPVNFWKDLTVPSTINFRGDTYTVTEVSINAFYKSDEVETIILPETIREIGNSAFYLCAWLKEINIPEGITKINSKSFYGCCGLTSMKLPSTIEGIYESAFMDCFKLKNINIPGKCEFIENDAFSWCIALDSLIIEDGNTPLRMGKAYEFGPAWTPSCEPYGYVERFHRGLFNDSPLKYLYVGRNIEYEENFNIMSPFEHCVINYASSKPIYFRTGNSYRKVSFGDMVTEIHARLFMKSSIPEISLPNSIVKINDEAFSGAINQSYLILPESCESIGERAFLPLNNYGPLRFIECRSEMPPIVDQTAFTGYDTTDHITILVPEGKRSVYKKDSYWGKFKICDPIDEMTEIEIKNPNSLYGKLAWLDKEPRDVYRLKLSGVLGPDDWSIVNSMPLYELDMSGVTSEDLSGISDILPHLIKFKFPKGVKTIQSELFSESHLQGEVIIPQECELIETMGFYKSDFISKVVITGPTVVEENAFRFCKKLSEVSILGNATLKENSFQYVRGIDRNDRGLETVTLGDGVKVCTNAFNDCNFLSNIIIDGNVEYIADKAFNNCENIKTMTISGSISKIDSGAYIVNSNSNKIMSLDELHINDITKWCRNSFGPNENPIGYAKQTYIDGNTSCSVDIPIDVEKIGDLLFENCDALTEVNITGEDTEIGVASFKGCRNLRSINIPDGTKVIGDSAFKDCIALNSVKLPKSLRELKPHLFENCSLLETIELPQNITDIPSHFFCGCEKLRKADIPSSVTTIGKHAFYNCKTLQDASLPLNCHSIDEYAFAGCSSISEVFFPQHLSFIGDRAFDNCSSLQKVRSLWTEAPKIEATTFNGINKKSILYVPKGSTDSYYSNGWGRITLIEEGFCVINLKNNLYGKVRYDNKEYRADDDVVLVDIDSDITLTIEPDENCYIKTLMLDDSPCQPDIRTTSLTLSGVSANHVLSVDYDKYVLGDVNNDDYIDVGDITNTVKHILHRDEGNFIRAAADTNVDNDIDVGDIRGIVNIIHELADIENGRQDRISNDETCHIDTECVPTDNENEYTLSLNIDNTIEVSGYQIDITLPNGVSILSDDNNNPCVEFSPERTSMMNIKEIAQINDSCYVVMCTATKPVNMECGKGAVLTMRLRISKECSNIPEIKFSDIRVSDINSNVYHFTSSVNMPPSQTHTYIKEIKGTEKNIRKYLKDGQIFIEKNGKLFNINGIRLTQV